MDSRSVRDAEQTGVAGIAFWLDVRPVRAAQRKVVEQTGEEI
jgi:hypothetical protein